MEVRVGVSNRHVHLTRKDLDILFGKGYELTFSKPLLQPGQFAAKETVTIIGPKGAIHNVRVLGPVRSYTQIEISRTDSFVLGILPPIRDSGDLKGAETLVILGPKGQIEAKEAVILPHRHIHMTPEDAKRFGVQNKQQVSVRVKGERALVLENVLCRVHPESTLEFHIDTDEANAANLKTGDFVEVITHQVATKLGDQPEPRHAKILVLNCGSSSVKYKVYKMPEETVVDSGCQSRIDESGYVQSIESVLRKFCGEHFDVICHRVVHGGEYYAHSVVIDSEVKANIAKLAEFAPLHNPRNLAGIEVCERLFPNTLQVAVFDTAFHQTMPPSSYLYSIPYEYYEKYGIRKYGFHGMSHRYVMERAEQLLEIPASKLRLLSCHIGNGVSICAIKNGQSFDTSMGLTPLAGLTMGTRSGNIDPGIIPFIEKIEQTDAQGVVDILNYKSGVLGVSGISEDLRDVWDAAQKGNTRAQLAIELFTTRIHKYIGLYFARLNGVDGIIFTAGIGENSPELREHICAGFEYAGVILDHERNYNRTGERFISAVHSPVKVMVIPTNEELMMARDGFDLFRNRNQDQGNIIVA
jgi:acetate kinase